MDLIQKSLLQQVAGLHDVPEGAFNIRVNGQLDSRNTTANIDIVTKEDNRESISSLNREQKMRVCTSLFF